MIAELYLILDLLGETVGDTPISPPPTGQPKPITSYGVTDQTTNGFGGGLFEVGPITEIKQPVIIPPISPNQFNQWYLDAIANIPITSLPYTGKR